jgi:hypothetical protein
MTFPNLKHCFRFLESLAGLVLLMLFAVSARAGLINADRDTTFTIAFASDTFSDASVFYNNNMTVNYDGTGPTTEPSAVNFLSSLVPGTFSLSGNATLTGGGPPPSTVDLSIGAPGWGFSYTADASTTPGQSFLTLGESGGLATLNLSASSSGLLDNGGLFTVEVFIPGNFSVSGTGTGDHMFNGLDPGFSIAQNFVYNSVIDETIFAVSDPNYQGQSVGLNFTLYGAAVVPEPATGALMGMGILAVAFAARRRRRTQ